MRRYRKPSRVLRLGNRIAFRILAPVVILVCATSVMRSQPKRSAGFVLNAPVGNGTGIRFFYYSGGDVVPGPIIIRPVEQTSPRLDTATTSREGLITYVLLDEMSQIIERLTQLDLPWKESKKIEAFKPFSIMDEPSVKVDIEVVSSAGTAKVKLGRSLACEKLAVLDSAFRTRRALLEFQEFRNQVGCEVSGFNHLEYMQMILRERGVIPQRNSSN